MSKIFSSRLLLSLLLIIFFVCSCCAVAQQTSSPSSTPPNNNYPGYLRQYFPVDYLPITVKSGKLFSNSKVYVGAGTSQAPTFPFSATPVVFASGVFEFLEDESRTGYSAYIPESFLRAAQNTSHHSGSNDNNHASSNNDVTTTVKPVLCHCTSSASKQKQTSDWPFTNDNYHFAPVRGCSAVFQIGQNKLFLWRFGAPNNSSHHQGSFVPHLLNSSLDSVELMQPTVLVLPPSSRNSNDDSSSSSRRTLLAYFGSRTKIQVVDIDSGEEVYSINLPASSASSSRLIIQPTRQAVMMPAATSTTSTNSNKKTAFLAVTINSTVVHAYNASNGKLLKRITVTTPEEQKLNPIVVLQLRSVEFFYSSVSSVEEKGMMVLAISESSGGVSSLVTRLDSDGVRWQFRAEAHSASLGLDKYVVTDMKQVDAQLLGVGANVVSLYGGQVLVGLSVVDGKFVFRKRISGGPPKASLKNEAAAATHNTNINNIYQPTTLGACPLDGTTGLAKGCAGAITLMNHDSAFQGSHLEILQIITSSSSSSSSSKPEVRVVSCSGAAATPCKGTPLVVPSPINGSFIALCSGQSSFAPQNVDAYTVQPNIGVGTNGPTSASSNDLVCVHFWGMTVDSSVVDAGSVVYPGTNGHVIVSALENGAFVESTFGTVSENTVFSTRSYIKVSSTLFLGGAVSLVAFFFALKKFREWLLV